VQDLSLSDLATVVFLFDYYRLVVNVKFNSSIYGDYNVIDVIAGLRDS